MKQYEAVIETLERLGGIATLGTLNQEVFNIEGCEWRTKTPYASIRRIVQTTKEIYKIKPGLYALEKYRKNLETKGIFAENDEHNANSEESIKFNHTYYQGLLLIIGNCRNMQTYVPQQDKNKIFFDGRKLSEISSIHKLPPYSYPELVKRSSTIDTVWLNQRHMPDSFFEIEHSTDIQNSLLKYIDLQDFHSRMVIVADSKRKPEFEAKLAFQAFSELRTKHRVSFLSYEDLASQYEMELKIQSLQFRL